MHVCTYMKYIVVKDYSEISLFFKNNSKTKF